MLFNIWFKVYTWWTRKRKYHLPEWWLTEEQWEEIAADPRTQSFALEDLVDWGWYEVALLAIRNPQMSIEGLKHVAEDKRFIQSGLFYVAIDELEKRGIPWE